MVSGSVSVPDGQAPEGGWPVISWAHGTTGVADACAPSTGSVPGSDGEYLRYINETIDRYVRAGSAVVQTDYVGMGTPGVHPYINGDSEANAVPDIVTAARDRKRNSDGARAREQSACRAGGGLRRPVRPPLVPEPAGELTQSRSARRTFPSVEAHLSDSGPHVADVEVADPLAVFYEVAGAVDRLAVV